MGWGADYKKGQLPSISFWVNLSLSETQDARPSNRGYVNLGLRRLNERGHLALSYQVIEQPCIYRRLVNASAFRSALWFEPYWPIGSSLRFNRGFWFELPNATLVPVACLVLNVMFHGAPKG